MVSAAGHGGRAQRSGVDPKPMREVLGVVGRDAGQPPRWWK